MSTLKTSTSLSFTELRQKLEQWNESFFASLQTRKLFVQDLQRKKLRQEKNFTFQNSFPHYDPQREYFLFQQFKSSLQTLSLLEILSYSLIMESHASHGDSDVYPAWSQKIHLQKKDSALFIAEMVNPLLLKMTHQDLWQKISLTPEFRDCLKDY